MCFNQDGAISSLNSEPMKLVDQLIWLGSNISTTESVVNICIDSYWQVNDIWESDLFDKIKWEFFHAVSCQNYCCTTWTLTKCLKKARWKLHKDSACCFQQILEVEPNKTATIWPFNSHLTKGVSLRCNGKSAGHLGNHYQIIATFVM